MATALPSRGTARRAARLALAGAALLAAASGASADDGIAGFFASIFGGQPQSAAPAPASARMHVAHRRFRERPLTVRLRPARPRMVAQAPTAPGKVSIFEDRTLRRGDAVMMAQGVRIFAGSTSWPYTAGDFVPLRSAKTLDSGEARVLVQLDKLPRG